MDDAASRSVGLVRRLRPDRIGLAWLTAIGVDLFFNAGLFAALFDQSREPGLLSDEMLVRRIPVAYVLLAIGVAALAWLLDAVEAEGRRGIRLGAMAGAIVGLLSLGSMWTALEMTGLFVVAGVVVTTVQGAAAAVVLTSRRSSRSLRVRVAIGFVLLAGIGQVFANLVQ